MNSNIRQKYKNPRAFGFITWVIIYMQTVCCGMVYYSNAIKSSLFDRLVFWVFITKKLFRHCCTAPFRLGIWNQREWYLKYNTDISSVFPRTFMDHLKENPSPGPGGNAEEILWALASYIVCLHLPDRDYPSSTVRDFWNCGNAFWIIF